MRKTRQHYGLKNEGGFLTCSIWSIEEMPEPWVLITQDNVRGGMIWDEAQDKFINPPS